MPMILQDFPQQMLFLWLGVRIVSIIVYHIWLVDTHITMELLALMVIAVTAKEGATNDYR